MNSADRKKQLIAQGAVYRAEVLHAKQMTHASLHPDSLARSALNQLAVIALSVFRNRIGANPAGAGMQALLPLLFSAASALSGKKSLLKRVLRGTLIAGGAAAAAAFLIQKKTPLQDPDRAS